MRKFTTIEIAQDENSISILAQGDRVGTIHADPNFPKLYVLDSSAFDIHRQVGTKREGVNLLMDRIFQDNGI